MEGQKISTSRNWAVWLTDYLKDFKNKQDELRYYLISILPENRDSEFTWKGFQERNNNELLAVLGNFFNRCMVLIHKYFNGEVPASQNQISEDIALYQYILEQSKRIEKHLWAFQFKEGMIEVMNLVRAGNKYLTETAPWQLVKIDKERAGMVLYMAVQLCASVAILIRPFLPETAKKMSDILNFSSESWKDCYEFPLLPPMHTIKKAKVLFEKIEDIAVEKQIQKLKQTTDEQETATSNIGFSDFQKLVLKVGTILSAKRVPKTDKLLEFQIDIGEAKARTIISGIAEQYSPDQLVNEQVIVLSNLEPKKMRGKLSQGMILLAEDNSGKLIFVSPEQKVKNGSVVA